MSKLLASLGHTGRRRVVLGHMLNTQTLTKANEKKKRVLNKCTILLGCIHSHPGLHAARRLWDGHPQSSFFLALTQRQEGEFCPDKQKKPESCVISVSHSTIAVHKGGILLLGRGSKPKCRSFISYTGRNRNLYLLKHKVALSSNYSYGLPSLSHTGSDIPLPAAKIGNPRSCEPSPGGETSAQGFLCCLGHKCVALRLKDF